MPSPRFLATDSVPEDVDGLMADLRREDREEWIAAGCVSTRHAVLESIAGFARTARLHEGGPVPTAGAVLCIWGVVPTETPGLGTGWLIGTKTGQQNARALHRILKAEFEAVTERYPQLQCWADDRNRTHHAWIRWLGFKPVSSAPFGPFGLPFTYYRRD